MSHDDHLATTAVASPQADTCNKTETRKQPPYHVVLWDDDKHTYEYVVRMMQRLFRASTQRGYEIATKVDSQGKAICLTTTLEHAELKRNQIMAFGADQLIAESANSMRATVEPAR